MSRTKCSVVSFFAHFIFHECEISLCIFRTQYIRTFQYKTFRFIVIIKIIDIKNF